MDDIADRDLLAKWCAGDRDAFAVLVSRHYGLVQAACRRQAAPGEDEDCTQAVFLVLARRPAAASRAPVLAAWLQRTAWYVCKDARRAAQSRRQAERAAAAPTTTTDECTLIAHEALEHLDGCLLKLPDKQRAAVTLHFLAGQTPDEVAVTIGIKRDYAYLLISRGFAGLRVLLARRGVVVAEVGLVSLLAAEANAATASTPSAVIASLSTTPSASACALATGALKTMAIAALAPIAAVAGLVLVGGAVTLALTAEVGGADPSTPAGTTQATSVSVQDGALSVKAPIELPISRNTHASLQAYSNAITEFIDEKSGTKVEVAADGRVLFATDASGKRIWQVDVVSLLGHVPVGAPVIRTISLDPQGKILAVVGKHDYVQVDILSGNAKYLGSD